MKIFYFSKLILICFLTAVTLPTNAQSWVPTGTVLNGESNQDALGTAVSMNLDGTIMAVGVPLSNSTGIVQVYMFEDDNWTPMGNPIGGAIAGERFGSSTSISADGQTLIVGAYNNSAGHAYVFEWSGVDWAQKGSTLSGENSDDFFGLGVDINADGTVIVVGAPLNDTNEFNAGFVGVYEWNGSDWSQRGANLEGVEEYEEFGQTVAMSADGNSIVIGSPFSFSVYRPGITRIYEWSGSTWIQKGVDIIGEGNTDHSGTSIDMTGSGETIAIGSSNNSHSTTFNAGHVRVFDWSGSAWTQRGDDIDGDASYDNSSDGLSMSDDGNTIASGAPSNDGNGDKSGQVKIYKWDGSGWTQSGADIYGTASGNELGSAVALNGDGTMMCVGAPKFDSQKGQLLTYALSESSAVYSVNKSISIEAFPNPTDGLLQIQLDGLNEMISIVIYNSMGQQAASYRFESTDRFTIEMPELAGFYFLEMKTDEGTQVVLNVLRR